MDRNRDIWFPAKRFGWGWGPPVKWQGWMALAVYVVAVVLIAVRFPPTRDLVAFLALVLLSSFLFGVLCWWKGETPRWRWGGEER